MVGRAGGIQRVGRVLARRNGGDQLRVRGGGLVEADDAEPAAGADGVRRALEAVGPVQGQDDVRGVATISGEAESARVTCSVPSQSMRSRLICLLVLVTPMVAPSYARGMSGKGNLPPFILCAGRKMGAERQAKKQSMRKKRAAPAGKIFPARRPGRPPRLRGKTKSLPKDAYL